LLTKFGKAGTDTFRVLQKLIGTLVHAGFLLKDQPPLVLLINPALVALTSLPVMDLVVKSLAQSSKQR
jgi:hypothetical protein